MELNRSVSLPGGRVYHSLIAKTFLHKRNNFCQDLQETQQRLPSSPVVSGIDAILDDDVEQECRRAGEKGLP